MRRGGHAYGAEDFFGRSWGARVLLLLWLLLGLGAGAGGTQVLCGGGDGGDLCAACE